MQNIESQMFSTLIKSFLSRHVTLKTGVMMLKIMLFLFKLFLI